MNSIKHFALSSIAATALLMSACSTMSTQDLNNLNPTAKGALAGAAAGALIESKGNRKDIAKGAAVGAVLGGGTGYVIDNTQ